MGLSACLGLAVVKQLTIALRIGIQMEWSDKAVDTQVISAIFQAYCILLPALLSIGRRQLSLFDANYALMITSSPLMIQVVLSSIREVFGSRTGCFKKIKSHHHFIYFSAALVLALWFGLRLTLPLSSKAFRDSELCSNPDPLGMVFELYILFVPATGPAGGFWAVLLVLYATFLVALIVGWYEVVACFLTPQEGEFGPLKRVSQVVAAIRGAWCVSITTGTG